MPRNGNGTYTLPAGVNPVQENTQITTSWANSTLNDIGNEITNSLAADGQKPMTAPLKFSDGTVAAPAITFNSEDGSGWYRVSSGTLAEAIGGVQVATSTASTRTFKTAVVLSGSNSLTVGGDASIGGDVDADGKLDVTGATKLSSTLSVTGATTLSSTLGVSGATTIGGALGVTGAATFSSTVTASEFSGSGASLTSLPAGQLTGTVASARLSGTYSISVSGNAGTATKLATGRTITLSGVTATGQSFDGSGNITIPVSAVPASLLTGTVSSDRLTGTYAISVSGNAATATAATSATTATNANKLLINGDYRTFNWSGQSGTPSYVWGSNDGANFYVWSPANFSVSSASNADTVDGQHASAFATASHTHTMSAITNLPTLAAGTYTPTIGGSGGTGAQSQYMRVGNVVTVSGNFTSSASGAASFTISLPISSNLTGSSNLSGFLGLSNVSSTNEARPLSADTSNKVATSISWSGLDSSSKSFYFHFTYLVQ